MMIFFLLLMQQLKIAAKPIMVVKNRSPYT